MTTPYAFTYIDQFLPGNSRAPTVPSGSTLFGIEKKVSFPIPENLKNKAALIQPMTLFTVSTTQSNRPASAMSSNTQTISGITYTASVSGPSATGQPYELFDDVTATNHVIGDGYLGGNNATGAYNGSIQTVDAKTGIVYAGAYVQLQTSSVFQLDIITLTGTLQDRRPKSIVLMGSNNASDWYFIQEFNNIVWATSNVSTLFLDNSATYFHVRMVITQAGLAGNNTTTTTLSDINLTARTESTNTNMLYISHNFKNYKGFLRNTAQVPVGQSAHFSIKTQLSGNSYFIGAGGNSIRTNGASSFAAIPVLLTDETIDLTAGFTNYNFTSYGGSGGVRVIYQFNIIPIE